MKKKESLVNILIEDIEDDVLSRMPKWFRVLRELTTSIRGKCNLLTLPF